MKKVDLRMNEQYKYEIIKKLNDGNITKYSAQVRLNVTMRSIERMSAEYKKHGKAYFMHGNRNSKPSNSFSEELINHILSLYENKYNGANFKHFTDCLNTYENIVVSYSFIKGLMKKEDIISPKALRRTKRDHNKRMRNKHIEAPVSEEIINHEIALEDAHPRRSRAKYEGELVQLDASHHLWFGSRKSHLHAAIDDASGKIIGLYFTPEETLIGYYNVYSQILIKYGIPYEFLTDRRTIFEYKQKKNASIETDTFTQFGYAAHQLGTIITTTSIPQAKGRVERLFGTLQSRLIIELQIRNIETIEEANDFLPEFIEIFNNQFALHINDTKNVYEFVNIDTIDYVLSRLSTRKIDNGNCISYKNDYYYPINKSGKLVAFRPKTKVMVIDTFKQELFVTVDESIYPLVKLEQNKTSSIEFDNDTYATKLHKVGTFSPKMSHPWKSDSFKKYCIKTQKKTKQEIKLMFDEIDDKIECP